MSSAHRPTWAPAQGKSDTRHASKITSVRDLPGQTTLKYRQPQQGAGQDGQDRASMRAQLDRAEREARNKKRKTMGLEPEEESSQSEGEAEDEEDGQFKKPKLIGREDDEEDEETQQIRRLDKGKGVALDDDEAEESDDEEEDEDDSDIEARAREILKQQRGENEESDDEDEEGEDDDDDDDDSEDETAQLMRELEKIKAERAAASAKKAQEEQEERERREEQIARGNPLLNGGADDARTERDVSATPFGSDVTTPSFGVKRRWDDDVIFKNQAAGANKPRSDFVNDLTRTEFHKEFMHRYIK